MLTIDWGLSVLGHWAVACMLFNRMHAGASQHRRQRKWIRLSGLALVVFASAPILLLPWTGIVHQPFSLALPSDVLGTYWLFARLVAVYVLYGWLVRNFGSRFPSGVAQIGSQWIDIQQELGRPLYRGFKARLLSRVPVNQATQLKIECWDWHLIGLPTELDGLTICQLSDLHFMDTLHQDYYREIVRRVNEREPDLIVITGDLCDIPQCLDWIQPVLQPLRSRLGNFYVLGNHDQRIEDEAELRRQLELAGCLRVADGQWHSLPVGQATILIAGNELPWFRPPVELSNTPVSDGKPLSILLTHSPDQIGWAVQRGFDIVFAGHTHGGQIRLPIIGPIISPSRYGVAFAGGTFRVGQTLMHVSRGIAGDQPIRIGCPPELGFFTLRRHKGCSSV